MHRTGGAYVGHHLLVFAPGDARRIKVRFKTARHELVVAQQCNPQALALQYQRRVGLFQVAATAKVLQPGGRQQGEHFGKCLAAIVARVVVGQGQRIEVALEHRQGPRVGPEGEVFVARRAGGGHHALEVANADIRLRKKVPKAAERVFAPLDHGARHIVEHDVSGKHQRHPA